MLLETWAASASWYDWNRLRRDGKESYKLVQKLFSTAEQRQMTTDPKIQLYSRSKINAVVQVVAFLIASIVFLVPMSILLMLKLSDPKRLTIIILSMVFFPLTIRPFTRPKSHELIAMTATYAAVLVVFVELNSS